MAIYKTRFIFSSATGSGWTESWYNLAAANLDAAGSDADTLAKSRVAVIGKGNSLVSWTVTDVAQQRLSLSRDGTLAPYVGNKFPTDMPSGSQLGVCTVAPQTGRRQFWMRGVPDDWIVWDPTVSQWVLVPEFVTAFKTFRTAIMKGGQWGLRTVKSYKQSTLSAEVLLVADDVASGFANLTLRAGSTLTAKKNIVVGGFKYPLQKLNGTYLAPNGYTQTGAVITLQQRFVGSVQAQQYVTGGTVRTQEFSYYPITACQYDRPGNRKVGKYLGVPAGRRSAR